jgi:segregation and condensation protein B
MSLKAKLEAVIYAAEEPVTLAQLAPLFAEEAFTWKAELDAAARPESDTETPLLFAAASDTGEPAESLGGEAIADLHVPSDDVSVSPVAGPDEVAPEHSAGSGVDTEAEAKRLARLRDRQVRTILRGLLDELIASYASDDRGIEIREIAGGYRMATKPECHDAARLFVKSLKPALKLSLPALETLAVIAYKQPVTAPEVNEIRGVDSSGVFGSLLARKLIATAGRKQVIGRPILYKTTKEFLLRFGLKDVTELPSMEEFEKIAQLEFEENEPAVEEELSGASDGDRGPEVDEEPDQVAAEPDGRDELKADATADTTLAEAAPAAPSSSTEQAEIETVPHD